MKRLLFFIFLFGSFLLADKVFAQTIICRAIPTQVPYLGIITGECTVDAGIGFCIGGRVETAVQIWYRYYNPPSGVIGPGTWEIRGSEEHSCDSAHCHSTFVMDLFNQTGVWSIEFCGVRRCYYDGYLDTEQYNCLPWEIIHVLPPQCGDGVVNQSNEECDDGNTNSGDGCDATCHLEGPTPPSQPTISPARAGFDNPLIWKNVLQFLLYILRFTFQIVLGVSILMVVLSGFFLAISRADPTRQEKGKRTLMYALIGFSIAFLANGLFLLFKIIFGVQIP